MDLGEVRKRKYDQKMLHEIFKELIIFLKHKQNSFFIHQKCTQHPRDQVGQKESENISSKRSRKKS